MPIIFLFFANINGSYFIAAKIPDYNIPINQGALKGGYLEAIPNNESSEIKYNVSRRDFSLTVDYAVNNISGLKIYLIVNIYQYNSSTNIAYQEIIELDTTLTSKTIIIENSYGYNGTVTLLYDDDVSLGSYQFAPSTGSNNYDSSSIKVQVDSLKRDWKNVSSIRLISAEEIGYIAKVSPKFRGYDVGNQNLSCAATLNFGWLISSSYWTMTGKLYSDTPANSSNINKKVWYVNSGSRILTDDYITSSHLLRPVIIIEKKYITTL